ncbi:MAG: fibronectin type III domain-containing protein, partial [Bacteroidota bacterium]
EDEGLVGSEAYAAWAQTNGIRIDGMITNDVVGNIRGSNGITDSLSVRHFSSVNDATPHRQMARYAKLKTETYYPIFTVNLIPDVDRPGRGGDHQSFQNHGYTAVRFTEPNENLAYQHTPADIVANMSPAYVGRVARVNALSLASLAWAPEKPSTPTLADPGNGTTLQVQWLPVPSVPDLAGYRVAVRDSGGLYYSQIHTVGNATQYTLNNLTPGVAVYVSVSAYDTAGNESMFSNEALGRPALVPTAPTNVTSTSLAASVRLTWNASPQLDVVKYRIYRSVARSSGFVRYDSVAASGTSYVDAGLSPHQLRYYHLRAVDADGNESTPSNIVAGQRASHDLGVLVVDGTKDGPGGPISPMDSVVDA